MLIPRRSFILQSVFYTNPEKYEELRAATFAILADLRANGPTEEEVESVRAQRLNNLQEAREENSYWLGSLRRVMIGVEDDYGYTTDSAALWENLSATAIQEQAEFALGSETYLLATLFPEALDPEGESGESSE